MVLLLILQGLLRDRQDFEQPLSTVSADLIRHLHLTQVQIDELWTFVKKNKRTVNQMILLRSAICGCGARWRYPAACAS